MENFQRSWILYEIPISFELYVVNQVDGMLIMLWWWLHHKICLSQTKLSWIKCAVQLFCKWMLINIKLWYSFWFKLNQIMGGIWGKNQCLKGVYLLLCDFFPSIYSKIHCCYDYTCHMYSFVHGHDAYGNVEMFTDTSWNDRTLLDNQHILSFVAESWGIFRLC